MNDNTNPPFKTNVHINELVALGAYTACGQRSNNEDAFSLPPSWGSQANLGTAIALADGVGGREFGEVASQEAVELFQQFYYEGKGSSEPGQRLRECVEAVNTHIFRNYQQKGDIPRGYTTLVAAVIYHDSIYIANVGDSRAYHADFRTKKIKRHTEDQIEKGGWSDKNELDATQTHVIQQAIGFRENVFVDLYHCHWQPGDRLVLTSDGLNLLRLDNLGDSKVEIPSNSKLHLSKNDSKVSINLFDIVLPVIFQPKAQESAQQLVQIALQLGGKDNCTAVVAEWIRLLPMHSHETLKKQRCWKPILIAFICILVGIVIGILLVSWLSGNFSELFNIINLGGAFGM